MCTESCGIWTEYNVSLAIKKGRERNVLCVCVGVGGGHVLGFGFLGRRFTGVGDSRCGHFLPDGFNLQTDTKAG